MATETIPVIDLGPFLAGEPGALDRTAKELRFALTEIGFYSSSITACRGKRSRRPSPK